MFQRAPDGNAINVAVNEIQSGKSFYWNDKMRQCADYSNFIVKS